MKGKTMLAVISIITILAVALTACSRKSEDDVKMIYIGYTGPLSGGMAKFGENCLDGINLAIDEINTKGLVVNGQRYKFELKALDDKYTPNGAATNAYRLTQEYKTPIVICGHSGGTKAIMQFNEKEGFIVAGYTTDTTLEELNNKMLIRVAGPYIAFMTENGFVKRAMERFGKRMVGVAGISDYAKNWTALLFDKWKAAGGEILGNYPVDYQKEADFYTPVSKALATKPEVIFIGGSSEPTALVIKQARELGYKGGFIVIDQAKIEEIRRILPIEMLEGYIGTASQEDLASNSDAFKIIGRTNKGALLLAEKFKKRYPDKILTHEGAFNYMLIHLMANSIYLSGITTDAKAIYAKLPAAIQGLPDELMPRPLEGITVNGGLINVTSGTEVKDNKVETFVVQPPEDYRALKVPVK